MGKFKGMICAAAIATLGVVGAGCDDDEDAVVVGDTDIRHDRHDR